MKRLLGNNHWIFHFTSKVVSIKIWQYIWMQPYAWLRLYTPTLEITSLDVAVPKFPSLCWFILPSLNPSFRVNQTAGFPGSISTIYSNQVWNVPQKSNWNFSPKWRIDFWIITLMNQTKISAINLNLLAEKWWGTNEIPLDCKWSYQATTSLPVQNQTEYWQNIV